MIHERDGHTDGQTDRHCRHRMTDKAALVGLYNTIQYKKTYKAPYVIEKLFVGAGVTRDWQYRQC